MVRDGYATPREAAALLGLAPGTVYSQLAEGALRAIRPSPGRYLLALAEVERYRPAPKRGGGRRGAAPRAAVLHPEHASVRQAATYLGVTPQAVYAAIRRGRLPTLTTRPYARIAWVAVRAYGTSSTRRAGG